MDATTSSLVNLLSELVAFPSESSKLSDCERCFDYLEGYLSERGMVVARLESNGFPSLMAMPRETMAPKILLQAHLDVVPARPNSYKMTEHEGKIYGRGVFDMKFAAACYLQLVEDLRDNLPDYDFGIMLTSDEEIGGHNGVAMLLDKGYGAKVCVLPDGGDDWQLEISCNGIWQIKLTATGHNAHASRPWEGENAINKLNDILKDIEELFGQLEKGKSTVVVSKISGGKATNQVPDYAEATIDMRYVTDEDQQTKQAQIEGIASRAGLKLETLEQCQAGKVDLNDPEIAIFMKVAETVYGQPVGQIHSLGASDARFFSQHNIPTILMRPAGGGAHSDTEWIDKQEFFQYYDLIKAYVTTAAKVS